ncbi:major facilitator superfamily domain-containing protein [Xylariales sp. PMI_506]|nr:major facilitator superfamily domain-containing protein [Xylariales sp. PMI_506]
MDEKHHVANEAHDVKLEPSFEPEDVATAVISDITAIDPQGPEARRVLSKIDWNLLPVLCFTYLIQFLDKSCVSYAALWGMKTDANLVGAQYSWLTTIFYLGYMASEFPINYLFQKFNIARTCGIFILLWGITLLCMTPANNFAGLATARFFLGVLEAGVSPCFVLLTAMFYRREEQPFRTAIWFSMNGLANILGGLIGYGIGFIHSGIAAWKFPFVIFGSVTIVWAIAFLFLAPANPTQAKWLTEEEKAIAVLRLVDNKTGIDTKRWKWHQVKEALRDPNFWLLNLTTLANNIPNGGVSAFAPLIVNGFGFTQFQSTLLNMPSGAAQIIALWISGYITMKFNGIRHFVMIGGILVAILGGSLIYALPDEQRIGRLIGYYLIVGFSVTFVQTLNLIQANVAGRTKRNMYTSSTFVSYCIGNLIGPQLFFTNEAPRYRSGFAAMLVCFGVQIFFISGLYVLNLRENQRRDKLSASNPELATHDGSATAFSDMTDRENQEFRYTL